MIRFTVVDRLVRLVMDVLSPKERVYMLYLLGIRNGICPSACLNIRGQEDQAMRFLRDYDSTMSVMENVYYLPHTQYEVEADVQRAIASSTLHLAILSATSAIGALVPSAGTDESDTRPERGQEEGHFALSGAGRSDTANLFAVAAQWIEEQIPEDAQQNPYLSTTAISASPPPEPTTRDVRPRAGAQTFNRAYTRLGNDYNNRRR